MVMAQLQDSVEWNRALFTDPERLARRLSKNQVVGRKGEWDVSKVLRVRMRDPKDCGLTNFSGLIKRKEMRRKRKARRPMKMRTLRMCPAGNRTAATMTRRVPRLDAIRQKGRRLIPTIE
jgi:hypothetical protein